MVRYQFPCAARRLLAWGLCMCLPAGSILAQHVARVSTGGTVAGSPTATAAITGVVRNRDTEAPIAGVTVQVLDAGQRTETGPDGRYTIDALSPGAHTLRCFGESYEPLTVVVTVNEDAQSVVDVGLVALPQLLSRVSVVATAARKRGLYDRRGSGKAAIHDGRGTGGTTWSTEAIRRSSQLAQSDVFQAVATAATVATRSEAPSSLHVTGGSADQNLIMLDGIPIENAVHAGDLTSAVDPAAINAMTLYDGRMPASLGGRLASVIELSMRGNLLDARRDSNPPGHGRAPIRVVGTAGTAAVGATFLAVSPALNASGLLSIRHSPHGIGQLSFADPQPGQSAGDGWFDVLARGSMWLAKGELFVLGFITHDAVRFDARGGIPAGGADVPTDTLPLDAGPTPNVTTEQRPFFANSLNGFAWRSSAVGITWLRPIGATTELDVRAWQSVAATSGAWGVGLGRAAMNDLFVHSGAVAAITRSTSNTWLNAGVGVDNTKTVYAVSTLVGNSAGSIVTADIQPHANLRLTAAPQLASAFIDTRLRITPWATASVGVRATSLLATRNTDRAAPPAGAAIHLEPRLGLTVAPGSRITLEAAYSRTEQRVQSLRNDESLFDNVIGLNLLTAIGNGVPTATSDLGSARATIALAPSITVLGGAYTRRLQHVLLAAPRAAAPFATDTFDIGSGHARGWYLTAQRATEHLQLDASFAMTAVSRGTTQMRYRPGFAAARSLAFGIAVRPVAHTTFRAAGMATEGRNAALTLGDFTWDWQEAGGTTRNFQGTPTTALIGRSHLPPYLRLDLGVRHDLVLHRASTLTLFTSVNNVFNHTNTAGYVRSGMVSPSTTGLGLLPRSLVAGLEWHW